ncbi:hypothetical protein BZA05DRAFT_411350 [Tricharina praecox]|uniref:uncharacterized protein n=1 Tax=Tricharina praecox TaxID=43433 RepID=UPI00221F567B|nr:uncharacterized protein BZA05DRAFT_411350 [Tricharina praecox]KAI5843170.1 hypothetical protein BZA05DRAFT_411350 [Tricharina praecox]
MQAPRSLPTPDCARRWGLDALTLISLVRSTVVRSHAPCVRPHNRPRSLPLSRKLAAVRVLDRAEWNSACSVPVVPPTYVTRGFL